MELIAVIIGTLGLFGTIFYGIRSRKIGLAFSRYVEIDDEVKKLRGQSKLNDEKVRQFESFKSNLYHHYYEPKSKIFVPGDKVKLISIPQSRHWISDHSKVGMTGVVVDYGPGLYEYTVYWSKVDYEGEPTNEVPNRWQVFFVNKEEIERIL